VSIRSVAAARAAGSACPCHPSQRLHRCRQPPNQPQPRTQAPLPGGHGAFAVLNLVDDRLQLGRRRVGFSARPRGAAELRVRWMEQSETDRWRNCVSAGGPRSASACMRAACAQHEQLQLYGMRVGLEPAAKAARMPPRPRLRLGAFSPAPPLLGPAHVESAVQKLLDGCLLQGVVGDHVVLAASMAGGCEWSGGGAKRQGSRGAWVSAAGLTQVRFSMACFWSKYLRGRWTGTLLWASKELI
jgi:hypothetical protein